ncbi:MAG: zinc-dependent metalloprotease [Deltaproteobacteria bacterium]|nr:zinc-dependent metalloprotease [Deltaproteobacteria bacterium]
MLRTIRSMLLLTALMAVIASPGCGDPREPINQIQPGAIEKSVFAGEWYFQQTVIDSPYSAGFTFVGEQGRLERVRWEVQETFLLARRTYEWIDGAEPAGIGGDQVQQGSVVAAYRIQSHFDIRRQYNPVTGEELNVVSENATDRPWYERQFMRVDWSTNLANATDVFAISRILDGIQMSPVQYSPTNPNDPNAPRFERSAAGDVNYIDVTNRMFVEPQSAYIEGFGAIPSCYLITNSHLDCAAAEVGLRNSFLRADTLDRDYQPMEYTGDRMERFGYFVTERAGYDPNYGVVEGARVRFANRHNLWQQSHRRNSDGTLMRCTSNDQCADGRGSVCDFALAYAERRTTEAGQWEGACTIAYRDRQTRPVVYYTPNLPEDLFNDAADFGRDWAEAFGDTVDSLRENECLANGGDAATCVVERDAVDSNEMYAVCHSPVIEADSDICGAVGLTVRPGDLRYSIIGWVSEPHLSSPLGYGPSSADPLTGEIIMANAFVYGAAMETLESYARDILRLLDGDVTIGQISDGATVQEWLNRMDAQAAVSPSGREADHHTVPIDGLDLERVNAAMDFDYARSSRPASPPTSVAEGVAAVREARDRLWSSGVFGNGTSGFGRLDMLRGTDIERSMVELTPELVMGEGVDARLFQADAITDDLIAGASIIQGNALNRQRVLQRYRDQLNADHCILDAGFADEGLLGLAREIRREADGDGTIEFYGQTFSLVGDDGRISWELVRNAIRHPIFHAVTAHEVGHTVGLRHNFSGSYDALNYRPRYWELRTADGTPHPRAWDPMTQGEIDGRILEAQYSTVMDYGVNFVVTDSEGLGHYDYAAIKMGYGDMVEVFTNAENPQDVANWNEIQILGWPIPLRLESFTGGAPSAYVYTEWPEVVGSPERIQQRADVPYTSLRPDTFLASQGLPENLRDQQDRPTVPYMFCSDEQADLGPDCQRYDQGADAYEAMHAVADSYWNYYIFANFRRQRLGFNPEAAFTRTRDRFFEKFQRANQIYSLYRPIFGDIFGTTDSDPFWTNEDGMGAWTGAVGTSFGMLTRVLTAPEPGTYTEGTAPDGSPLLVSGGSALSAARINALDGRFLETTWDFDAGYFWFDQLERVGYFYDKLAALIILTDPTTYFLGRDTDADIRRYQISFASTFGPSVTSLFRGMLGEDWATIAPRISGGNVVYPDALELAEGDMAGTPITPNVGFSVQLFASVLGMSYLPQTYDQDFLNRSRIWVVGASEAIDVEPGTPTVEFTDSASGIRYVAVSYPDGARETGVGAQMLLHAEALRTAGATAETRRFIDNIDLVRRLSAMFGDGVQPIDHH